MTVLYFSKTGTTQKMAETVAAGMQSVEGVEAKAFPLDAVDENFLKESRCVVLGTPTYLATMAAPVKTWLDTSPLRANLAGKIGGAFATADYIHGGGDIGIQSILSHLMVLGMLAYSGGGSFGKPVIHFGPVAIKEKLDDYLEVFTLYGKRMATKTVEIFGK